ncbi:hypothetical protein B0T22DRAFT_481710 [Podospora appendiculata]|uniref:Uncharacterized protein n=1 Tax=Podospora appendiculata TaxID=314037 RepID=A0AAE0XDF1_9PEZI|nr:hypothetical protein B0T22DRAFT_481710 [Podospora appendiculata]
MVKTLEAKNAELKARLAHLEARDNAHDVIAHGAEELTWQSEPFPPNNNIALAYAMHDGEADSVSPAHSAQDNQHGDYNMPPVHEDAIPAANTSANFHSGTGDDRVRSETRKRNAEEDTTEEAMMLQRLCSLERTVLKLIKVTAQFARCNTRARDFQFLKGRILELDRRQQRLTRFTININRALQLQELKEDGPSDSPSSPPPARKRRTRTYRDRTSPFVSGTRD